MNNKDRVLQYMKEHNGITTWEAFEYLGNTRLSEYIRQLRQQYNIVGECIKTTNRFGEKTFYYKYKLVEKE